ncbi:MAG: carbon-nitrogen family hydrolase [Proteobacteria bacterium]|nr:carbon-nitrogen family hydrolase [Pseudomonadota bacterium]
MRITSIQMEMKERSKEENLGYALSLLDSAPKSDLYLFPEIWPCGFFSFDRYRPESEPLDGPLVRAFQKEARARNCHIHMGSMVEKDGDRLFNTSLLLDPRGEIIGRYRKIHLFGYKSKEKGLLSPGKEVAVVKTPWGLAGMSTCYDLRFPEFYRKMLDQGAKLFLVASAWPRVRLEAWRLFNRTRALENLAYLFSCNCGGANAGTDYAGHSMLVDPLGNIVAEGGEGEGYVSADVDPDLVNTVRSDFSALDDRVFR